MFSSVIFDLDGTLGDSLPVCFEAFRRVFERHQGVRYTDAEVRAMFGPTAVGIFESRLEGDPMAYVDEYLDEYRDAHDFAPSPFPGILELLEKLRERSVRMAVVTGKGAGSAAISLDRWGLRRWFDPILCGGDRSDIKRANMAAVLEAWGVGAHEVVAVGDVPNDVAAAQRNSIAAVSAAWAGTVDRAALVAAQPMATFDSVDAFATWLLERV